MDVSRKHLLLFIIVALIFLACLLCGQVGVKLGLPLISPSEIEAIKADFPIEELLDVQNMSTPDTWPPLNFAAISGTEIEEPGLVVFLATSKIPESTFFVQKIHLFTNSFWAHLRFNTVWDGDDQNGRMPISWDFIPIHADEFDYRCYPTTSNLEIDACDFLIRYSEVVIYIRMPINESATLENVEQILTATDAFMAGY